MGHNQDSYRKRLARLPTNAQRPQEFGHNGSVLARRQAAGVRLWGSKDQALGRWIGSTAADARRPHEFGHNSSVLARRQAAGVRLWG